MGDEPTDLLDKGTIPDYFTPLMQFLYDISGMIACYGTIEERRALMKAGIGCHAPMLDRATGCYQWYIRKQDYARAMKITGGTA